MSHQRIVLRLDERIPFEKELFDAYRHMPVSRRQEWIRGLLKAGMEAAEGNPATALRTTVATALVKAAKPIQSAQTIASLAPAALEAAQRQQTSGTGASAVKGFFGEMDGQGAMTS